MEDGFRVRSWLQVLSACDELEKLLDQAAPYPDPQRVQRVRFVCAGIGGRESYVTEQANWIASRIEIYCSARKHEKVTGGAPWLMAQMKGSRLRMIRDIARQRLKELGHISPP